MYQNQSSHVLDQLKKTRVVASPDLVPGKIQSHFNIKYSIGHNSDKNYCYHEENDPICHFSAGWQDLLSP